MHFYIRWMVICVQHTHIFTGTGTGIGMWCVEWVGWRAGGRSTIMMMMLMIWAVARTRTISSIHSWMHLSFSPSMLHAAALVFIFSLQRIFFRSRSGACSALCVCAVCVFIREFRTLSMRMRPYNFCLNRTQRQRTTTTKWVLMQMAAVSTAQQEMPLNL